MSNAKAIGAVDKTTADLTAAVKDSDIVILALPLDQIKEVTQTIAPIVKDGTLVMETCPVKLKLSNWMVETLPGTCSTIGLTPVLNPKYLHNQIFGIHAAKADMFQDGLFCVTTPPGADSQAVQNGIDLIQDIGAAPLFVDVHEIDGLMATVHVLPQLMSIALLNTSVNQPGWNEARKIAGRAFTEVTGPAAHLEGAEAITTASGMNTENITRKLDDMIMILREIRAEIAQGELQRLETRITDAKAGVDTWLKERGSGNWLAEELPDPGTLPRSSEVMGSLLGFGLGRKKKKNKNHD